MSDLPATVCFPRPGATIDSASVGVCPSAAAVLLAGADFAAGAAWPAANRAIYVPFTLIAPVTVKQILWVNGTVNASAHIDVGVYSDKGTLLVSAGSTTMSGANAAQVANVADTVLPVGRYFMAMAVDTTTTATFFRAALNQLVAEACGVQQEASAFPLPATATPVNPTADYVPRMALITNSVV